MKKNSPPKPHKARTSQMADHRYFTIFDRTPISTQIFSPDGTTIAVNKAWEKLWGVPGKKIVGVYNILKDKQLVEKKVMPYVKKAFRGETAKIPAIRYEPRQTIGDIGAVEYRILGASIYPIKDAKGDVREVVLVHEDITEQVTHEEELRKSEERYRNLVEMAPDVIYSISLDGKLLSLTPAFAKLTGWKVKEWIGKNFTEIVHPEDVPLAVEKFKEGLKQKTQEPYELRIKTATGGYLYGEFRSGPLVANGKTFAKIGIARDITRRKFIDKALEESRNQLEIVVQGVADGITMQDATGRVIFANEAAARSSGYSSVSEMLRAQPGDFLIRFELCGKKGEDFPMQLLPGRRALLGEKEPEATICFRDKKTGEERWSVVKARPVFDGYGNVQFAINIIHDITERKKAEDKIRENEQRFRTFTDFAPVGIFQTDPDGNCLFVNKRWCEMAGMSLEDAKGQGWVKALHPDDKERVFKEWYVAAKNKKEFLSIYRFQAPSGKVTWLQGNAIGLKNNGKLIGYLGAVIDITKQKESEERLAQLANIVESSDDAIVSRTVDGKVLSWNKGAEKLYGYTEKEILRKNVSILVPEDKKDDIDYINDSVRKGREVKLLETVRLKKDGGRVDVSMSLSPIRDSTGKLIGISAIARDISHRKAVERQKDEFIGIASHELKTPVTSLKAYAQAMLKRYERQGDVVSASSMAKMDTQLDKLTNLITDLLDVTKLDTNKLLFHHERFDMTALAEEIIEQLQRTTEQHTIILQGKVTKPLYADRERTGQVFINFISNAIKYSPRTNKIVVKLSQSATDVTVCVEDFGVGIDEKDRTHVFERFYRVSGPKQNTYPGLGLGLYISSEIIKRQGGKIWVGDKKGKGALFCFSLPFSAKAQ